MVRINTEEPRRVVLQKKLSLVLRDIGAGASAGSPSMDEFRRRQQVIARDMLRTIRRTERVLKDNRDHLDRLDDLLNAIDTASSSRSSRRPKVKTPLVN
jgi:hypothetical protein